MIDTLKKLKKILKLEKKLYLPESLLKRIQYFMTSEEDYILWKYIKLLRKQEYFYIKRKNALYFFGWIFYTFKKNRLGIKIGIVIPPCTIDEGLRIWHAGGIVVNGRAKIGKNCQMHGKNCIGNNSKTKEAPIIGDNVDIGVGASIIGNIKIGNNNIIGAGSVVVKSFLENNITIVGIPAIEKERKH